MQNLMIRNVRLKNLSFTVLNFVLSEFCHFKIVMHLDVRIKI